MTAAATVCALTDLAEEAGRCRELWVAVVSRVMLDAARRDAEGEAARRVVTSPGSSGPGTRRHGTGRRTPGAGA